MTVVSAGYRGDEQNYTGFRRVQLDRFVDSSDDAVTGVFGVTCPAADADLSVVERLVGESQVRDDRAGVRRVTKLDLEHEHRVSAAQRPVHIGGRR